MSADDNKNHGPGFEETEPTILGHLYRLEQFDKDHAADVPFDPDTPTSQAHLRSGQGTATVAGGNHEGIVEDFLKRVAEPLQDGVRHAPDLAKRMLKRAYIDVRGQEERDAVVAAAGMRENMRLAAIAAKSGKSVSPCETGFAAIGPIQRQSLLDRFIRGRADHEKQHNKDRILGPISQTTMINSSYGVRQAASFEAAIKSLMPRRS